MDHIDPKAAAIGQHHIRMELCLGVDFDLLEQDEQRRCLNGHKERGVVRQLAEKGGFGPVHYNREDGQAQSAPRNRHNDPGKIDLAKGEIPHQVVPQKQIEGINARDMDIEAHRNTRGLQKAEDGAENKKHQQQIFDLPAPGPFRHQTVDRQHQIQADETVDIPHMGPGIARDNPVDLTPDPGKRNRLSSRHLLQKKLEKHIEKPKDPQRLQHPKDVFFEELGKGHLAARIQQKRAGNHDKAGHRPHHVVLDGAIHHIPKGECLLAKGADRAVHRMQNHDPQAGHSPQIGKAIVPGSFRFRHERLLFLDSFKGSPEQPSAAPLPDEASPAAGRLRGRYTEPRSGPPPLSEARP